MKTQTSQRSKGRISPKQLIMMLPLCAVLGLNSCQFPLVDAVKRGDIAAVKQEIAVGPSTFQINLAADAAIQNGNPAILEELIKAGAIVAPGNAAGLTFVLQVDKKGETVTPTEQVPAALKDESSISPIACWQPVQWYAPASDDYCRLRELKWGSGQGNSFETETNDSDGRSYDYQSYKRLDRSGAILFDSSALYMRGSSSAIGRRWFKYELDFDTPTSGTFYGYDGQMGCNLIQLKGRFWLKNQPIDQKKSTTNFEAPTSLKGKKIVMDYSAAQERDRNDGMPDGVWNAWSKCTRGTETTKAFGNNNKCLNMKEGGESAYWLYKKTGTHTAELDNGIGGESGLGFPAVYTMTFESATTGTMHMSTGGEGEQSETTGIRFTIK